MGEKDIREILVTPIEKYFDADIISIRAFNCCQNHDIITVGDLVRYHKAKGVKSLRNCGKKTAEELMEIINRVDEPHEIQKMIDQRQYNIVPQPLRAIIEKKHATPLPGFSTQCIESYYSSFDSAVSLYFFFCVNQYDLPNRFSGLESEELKSYCYRLLLEICSTAKDEKLTESEPYELLVVAKFSLMFCDDQIANAAELNDKRTKAWKEAVCADYTERISDLSTRTQHVIMEQLPTYKEAIRLFGLSIEELGDCLFPKRLMRKTTDEIFFFLQESKKALLEFDSLDEREIKRQVVAGKYPYLESDDYDHVSDFHEQFGRYPMFFLLRKALSKSKERQDVVFAMSTGLLDGRRRTLEEIGDCYGLTRERIRQILHSVSKSLFRDKEWKLYHFKDVTVATEDDELYLNVVRNEKVDISFEVFARVCSLGFPLKSIKENGELFLLNNRFDNQIIDEVCQNIKHLKSKKRGEDEVVQLDSLLVDVPARSFDTYRQILLTIIAKAYGIIADDNGNMLFPKSPKIGFNKEEELYIILKENGAPMSLTELFEELKRKHPEIKYEEPEQIRWILLHSDRISAIGKTSKYALSEWENVFKGNIRDLIIQILENSSEPVHIDNLMKAILPIYPNTSKNSVLSSMYNDSTRFISIGDGYYGLAKKNYQNWRKENEELDFKEKCEQYLDFVKTRFYLPSATTNRKLYQWFKTTKTIQYSLVGKKRTYFEKLLKELRARGICI